MPVELGPVRVYLMYMIPVCCLFLTFLLLYPELLVKYRFKPAICTVCGCVGNNSAACVNVSLCWLLATPCN
jgi:hypothetical protein